jgi:hypothetical protein
MSKVELQSLALLVKIYVQPDPTYHAHAACLLAYAFKLMKSPQNCEIFAHVITIC